MDAQKPKVDRRLKDLEMTVFAAFDDDYAQQQSLPLYLINGSLGAGKTTVMEYLLSLPEFKGSRVIENEFANENIDGFRLEKLAKTVTTLSGDCICCTSDDVLIKTLYDLSVDSVAPVLIEATGVAHTMNLVERLVKARVFDRYNLAHSFYVISAEEILSGIAENHELEMQAADTILLTKTDLLSDEQKIDLTRELDSLSYDRIIAANRGEFDFSAIPTTSKVLEFFDTYDGELAVIDNPTYSVLDVTNLPIESRQMEDMWTALSSTYGLRRLKGAFKDASGKRYHVEATPAQIEVSSAAYDEVLKLVLIGKNADQISKSVFEADLLLFS